MPRYIFLTKGTDGDFAPMYAIACEMSRRGHDVAFIGHYGHGKHFIDRKIEFFALDSMEEWAAFRRDIHLLNTPKGTNEFIRNRCLPTTAREYKLVESVARNRPAVLVIRHAVSLVGPLAAQGLGITTVSVMMSPAQAASERTLEYLIANLYRQEIETLAIKLAILSDRRELLIDRRPHTTLALWPAWFDTTSGNSTYLNHVGFVTCDELDTGLLPNEVTQFLTSHPVCALVTGSTADAIDGKFYESLSAAFEAVGLPYVIIQPRMNLRGEGVRLGLIVDQRLPLNSLLPKMVLAAHHGGMGTISRCVYAGIPQLIVAQGSERIINGSIVERNGLGYSYSGPQWSVSKLAHGIERIVSSSSVQSHCRRYGARLSSQKALERSCNVLAKIAVDS